MIRIEHVSKSFGGETVLRDVSCHIRKGERVAVIGASGVGKSVFLRLMNGLVRPDAGSVFVAGHSLTHGAQARKAGIAQTGMVFQQFQLFSHLNVIDNIALAPIVARGTPKAEAFAEAERLLSLVGLPEKRFAMPSELSGGQMQRVGIARALSLSPAVLLMDEPTSALDPSMKSEVLSVIERVASEERTLVLVTHELAFVRSVADRALYIDECGIYEENTPEALFTHPEREKTKAFLRASMGEG